MSLRLADHWVWDSWLVEDGVDYHLFHARSTDLESWEVQPPTPPVDHRSLYAGRLVRDGSGRWVLLGFRDTEEDGFVGEICDPIPVNLDGEQVRIAR